MLVRKGNNNVKLPVLVEVHFRYVQLESTHGNLVELREFVGIITGQSIEVSSAQLNLRTKYSWVLKNMCMPYLQKNQIKWKTLNYTSN